jgi:HMG (high mobility group) box
MKVTEVMKELGVRWKILEDDEKTVYEDRVTLEKQRYLEKVGMNYFYITCLFFNDANDYDII